MKVELSGNAEADLRSIVDWIAPDNPAAARALSQQLRLSCSALSRLPKRFPLVRRVNGRDLRKRAHGSYLIFYTIWDNRVEILRIVHGSRDWAALLVDDA